ncbi:hypothetical protein HPB50_004195 [Hyalomma asiaticum]|uniref:Uncharacterized protein n=1 Tax=Hyalomma asiaticum TaxID=266040 RepID=A0ACB7SV81_HYAAI|nr:hypothetical protein HPB50_004195 [Hyalomma asiaticum]
MTILESHEEYRLRQRRSQPGNAESVMKGANVIHDAFNVTYFAASSGAADSASPPPSIRVPALPRPSGTGHRSVVAERTCWTENDAEFDLQAAIYDCDDISAPRKTKRVPFQRCLATPAAERDSSAVGERSTIAYIDNSDGDVDSVLRGKNNGGEGDAQGRPVSAVCGTGDGLGDGGRCRPLAST